MSASNPALDDHWVWGLYEKGLTVIPLGTAGERAPGYIVDRHGSQQEADEQWPKTPREKWADWQKFNPPESKIEEWLLKYPGCNFAIVTGKEVNVVDADDQAAIDYIRANLTRTPWVVRTGKGAHFYYQTSPTLIIKNSADKSKIDTRGVGGYVVAPGSMHASGRQYTLEVDPAFPVDSVHDLPTLSGDDLQKIAEYRNQHASAPAIKVGSGTKLQFDATRFAPGQEQGVVQGSRDDNMTRLVGRWVKEGLGTEQIMARAKKTDEGNTPPLGEANLLKIIQSVVGTHLRNNPQPADPTPRNESGAPLIKWANTTEYKEPSPLEFVIDDYLVAGTTSMVFGGPGICKSFLVQDMGMCVASGTAWHGREVHHGMVFYVCGEGHQDLPNRIHAWKSHHGYTKADTFPFFHSEHEINLRDGEMVGALVDLIKSELKAHPPRLIIVDTLSTNFGGGDENSGDMADFIGHMNGLARDTGAHVLIVHHTGKDKDKGARGSSSSEGNVFTYMPVDEKDGLTRLSTKKQKGGPAPKPLGFKMELKDLGEAPDSRGRMKKITSLVPVLELDGNTGENAAAQIIDQEKKRQQGGMLQQITQRTIKRLYEQATNNPPSIDQKSLYEALKAAGIPSKKTTEYKNYAINEGMIEQTGNREIYFVKTVIESWC